MTRPLPGRVISAKSAEKIRRSRALLAKPLVGERLKEEYARH